MTDIVLRNIDQTLFDRIRRVAQARDWSVQEALMHLLEHGLFACESEIAGRLDESDTDALKAAVAALEQIPDDAGFAMIGRAQSPAARPPGPDQSVSVHLFDNLPMPEMRLNGGRSKTSA